MKIIFLLSIFIATISLPAFGFHTVDSLLDRQRIVVVMDPGHQFTKDKRVAILAQDNQHLVAIGIVEHISATELPEKAIIRIEEAVNAGQVLVGDSVDELTPKTLEENHVGGHLSLLLGDEEKVPAKYKELAYMGVFNSEGHALAPKEWLISLTSAQYGIRKGTTIKIQTSLLLDGFANLGFKQRIMRSRFGHLTLNGMAGRQVNRNDWLSSVGAVLTMPSNGKYQTHLVINARLEGIEEDNPEVDKLNLLPESDVRTIYEYVTDDWDRWLFGPLFNFDQRTVGGTIGHMWIWDTFHLNVGLAAKNVAELEFKSNGYYVVFDFFWRF